jgi:hypothetical protein
MTQVLQRFFRLATLLIGVLAPAVALAVATVDVTATGTKANETTIQLFDSTGNVREPVKGNPNRYEVPEGSYTVSVVDARGNVIGRARQPITLTTGTNQLRVNSDSGEVTPPTGLPPLVASIPSAPTSQFWGSIGPGWARLGSVNAFANPANDQALIGTSRTVSTLAGEFGWRALSGLQFNVGGMGGDRSNSVQVPLGETAGYSLFRALPSGVTGFAGVNGGAGMTAKVTFSDLYFDFRAPPSTFKDEPRSKWRGNWIVGFLYAKTKSDFTFSVLADPSIAGTMNYKVQEYDARLGYEVRGEHNFENGLTAWIGAGLDGIYYHGRLTAMQNFACPICTPELQMLSQSASDTKNKLTAGASGTIGLSFAVSENGSFLSLAAYNHEWNVPTAVGKVAPSGPGPGLTQHDRDIATLLFGFSYKF